MMTTSPLRAEKRTRKRQVWCSVIVTQAEQNRRQVDQQSQMKFSHPKQQSQRRIGYIEDRALQESITSFFIPSLFSCAVVNVKPLKYRFVLLL